MLESVLARSAQESAWHELLRPEILADGSQSEQRVVYCSVSWTRYLAVDKTLGNDRPGPRLSYLDGALEIMTTSREHERLKEWLGGFIEDYLLLKGIEATPRGQATLRLALKHAGAEPDKSWCLGQEKKFPDLVLEIVLTSGGLDELEIYRRFKIPEVWLWRRGKLEVFILLDSGQYEPSDHSRLLPEFDLSLAERCVRGRTWRSARRAFRAGLETF
jgi:Uma2 family endonuclease